MTAPEGEMCTETYQPTTVVCRLIAEYTEGFTQYSYVVHAACRVTSFQDVSAIGSRRIRNGSTFTRILQLTYNCK